MLKLRPGVKRWARTGTVSGLMLTVGEKDDGCVRQVMLCAPCLFAARTGKQTAYCFRPGSRPGVTSRGSWKLVSLIRC